MKNSLSSINDIASRKYHIKGFTLIELLIYTGISVIIGGLTVGTLLTVTRVNQNASATAEVSGQMNFVLQRLQQLVSESSNIDIDAGITTSSVKLRMQDSAKDPTCISLVNGVIKIAEGPGSPNPNNCNSTASDLTSSKVVVNILNFKKMVQYPGHDTLSIDMTMAYNTSNPGSQVSRSLSSAIGRVSAATFDSNILPGATSYTIGQSGLTWQNVFVGDGSISSPSYSFGADTNVGIFRPGADILGFSTNSLERMRIDASGNVGIGTTGPGYTLTVNGTAWVTSGAWSGSDIRWKKDITPLSVASSLDKIMQLNPVSFDWRTDEFPNMHFSSSTQIGFIAQDVEKIIPEVVTTDNNGYKGISYERIAPVLTAALQEQQKQIEELKAENRDIKAENEALKKRIESLETR